MPATCEPGELMGLAKCFTCVGPQGQQAIQTYLLCQIAGMPSCEPSELMSAAKCFTCLEANQLAAINTYLLCQILAGGGPGLPEVLCGAVNPTVAPAGACAIYYRTDNGGVWVWNAITWLPIIAP